MTTTIVPDVYELAQNYPNPFNATTKIMFGLPQAAQVRLDIYNIAGQKVRTLIDEYRQPGFYSLEWNGADNNGNTVSSGTYLYRLTSGNDVRSMKMTLLK